MIKSSIIQMLGIPQPVKEGTLTIIMSEYIPRAGRVVFAIEWLSSDEIQLTAYAIGPKFFVIMYCIKTQPSAIINNMNNAREGYGFNNWDTIRNFTEPMDYIQAIMGIISNDLIKEGLAPQLILSAPIIIVKEGQFVTVDVSCDKCIKKPGCPADGNCKVKETPPRFPTVEEFHYKEYLYYFL